MSVESLLTFLFRLHRPTIENDENGYKEEEKYNTEKKKKKRTILQLSSKLVVVDELKRVWGDRKELYEQNI